MAKRRRTASSSRKAPYHHGNARAALIEAACGLVEEQGANFSMREAARLTGIDPAAVYRHFRDRGELLAAVAQCGFAEMAALMQSRDEVREGSSFMRIVALGLSYIEYALAHPQYFRLMFGGSGLPARDPKHRPEAIHRTPYELLEDALRGWAKTQHTGDDADAPDVTHTATLLWAGVHGIARLAVDGALELTPERIERLTTDLCKGVLNHSEP